MLPIAVLRAASPFAPAAIASEMAKEKVVSSLESLTAKSDLRLVSVVPSVLSIDSLVVPKSVAKLSIPFCRAMSPLAPALIAASILSDKLDFKFAISVVVAMFLVALVTAVLISAAVAGGLSFMYVAISVATSLAFRPGWASIYVLISLATSVAVKPAGNLIPAIALSISVLVATPLRALVSAVCTPVVVARPLVASVIFVATSARDKPG